VKKKEEPEYSSVDLEKTPGSINEQRGFNDTDEDGKPNPDLKDATDDFLLEARNKGVERDVGNLGGEPKGQACIDEST